MLYPPMDVRIETTDGRVIEGCEPFVKGHPQNPFTLADCVERFMTASAAAVRPLARERLERFVSMVEHLEDVRRERLSRCSDGAAAGLSEETRQ